MRTHHSLARIAVAAIVSLVALTGCSAISERFGGHQAETGSADPVDATFAQMMIPHHQQALEMAALAPARSTDPQVLELAREIAAAQQPEIDQMTAWLAARGAATIDDHSGHDMAGMAGDEEMAALAGSTGEDFDRRFLTLMIAHHEGALTMAEPVKASGDPEIRQLAAAIVSTQADEIALMRGLLSGSSTS
jgi:uncharacterized protein (DUF305 family)